jgi:hypothetical protein
MSDRVATLSGPVTGGRIVAPVCPIPVDLAAQGYVEEEFFASGTAVAFAPATPLTGDGRWELRPTEEAEYRTRVVVRRPAEASRCSGTVLVEWCNVSGGVEAAADWSYLHEEILRAGHAYVAVSAQAFGVDGGTPLLDVPGVRPRGGLVGARPERYGSLVHPGDQFSYDLFSQIGRALRIPGDATPLPGLPVHRVVAMGESQSAYFLTTYVNGTHHGSEVYDAIFVHSRGGSSASLTGFPRGGDTAAMPAAVRLREDVRVPVFTLETETDVGPRLDFSPARQPDTDRIRTWEVAGTAHADAYLVGAYAHLIGCDFPVNRGPHHEVAQAALHALVRWVDEGTPPPAAPSIELASGSPPVIARDGYGNALGGVRTPDVDVPVAVLSGDAPADASELCILFGSTLPFDGATLRRLYGDEARYRAAYEESLDAVVAAGFVLDGDRHAMLARAEAVVFPA